MNLKLFLISVLLILAQAFQAVAADTSVDEILDGFEESDVSTDEPDEITEILEGFDSDAETPDRDAGDVKTDHSIYSLDGSVKFGSTYNFAHDAPEHGETDWRGFSRLRWELSANLNARFSKDWRLLAGAKWSYDAIYGLRGRDEFTDDVLDGYEKELELRDVWLLGKLTDRLDIKIGRQIEVWGKSDNIRVTDVLNPLDMREPGLTDIEDLRLPVAMTKLDWYFGEWNLRGIAIHEIRFDKNPEYGSDFYPGGQPSVPEEKPSHGGKNTEFAVAASGIFSGWDIALYYAHIFDHAPHIENAGGFPPAFKMAHSRLNMFGLAFNIALGNWLLKAESAHFEGIGFFNSAGVNTPGSADNSYSRTDILIGAEYSGFDETTVSIEAVDRHIHDFNTILEQAPDNANEDEIQMALRFQRDFLNDALGLTILASWFDLNGDDGAFGRFSLAYDLTDEIDITGGVALYKSGDLAQFNDIGDNDRVFLEMSYGF